VTSNTGQEFTIRDAVKDTYPHAKTLDDLLSAFLGSNLIKESSGNDGEEDADGEPSASSSNNETLELDPIETAGRTPNARS
jgi:hypothetical protein